MTSLQLDEIANRSAEVEQPTVAREPDHFGPLEQAPAPDFVVFMLSTMKCAACHLINFTAGTPVQSRIHVHRSGDFLTITDADDLHEVGAPLIARHTGDLAHTSIFHLLSEAPADFRHGRFRPAHGVVSLSLSNGHWTLSAVGAVAGGTARHGHLYHATEIRD